MGTTHDGVGAMRWPLTKGTGAAAADAALCCTTAAAVVGLALAGLFVCADAPTLSAMSVVTATARPMWRRVAADAGMRAGATWRPIIGALAHQPVPRRRGEIGNGAAANDGGTVTRITGMKFSVSGNGSTIGTSKNGPAPSGSMTVTPPLAKKVAICVCAPTANGAVRAAARDVGQECVRILRTSPGWLRKPGRCGRTWPGPPGRRRAGWRAGRRVGHCLVPLGELDEHRLGARCPAAAACG